MSQIYDRFHTLILSRPHYRARGWINVNCPACGDQRQRGGFMPTNTGGFRYYCYNGGCTFHDHATGWEPGNGLSGRPRYLFELLGGNIRDIPIRELLRQNRTIYDETGNVIGQEERLETVTKFPDVELPERCEILSEVATQDKRAQRVQDYLLNKRGEVYRDLYPFLWTPEKPDFLIIPYLHYKDQVVGYLGRDITKTTGKDRFIQRAPQDYMFGQHTLFQKSARYVLVMESPLAAIALRGVATRGSTFTDKQINLLKISGREPILVPDKIKRETSSYLDTAESNKWRIAVPKDDKGIKDPGDMIRRYGVLYTMEYLVSNATFNYTKAKVQLNTKGI